MYEQTSFGTIDRQDDSTVKSVSSMKATGKKHNLNRRWALYLKNKCVLKWKWIHLVCEVWNLHEFPIDKKGPFVGFLLFTGL